MTDLEHPNRDLAALSALGGLAAGRPDVLDAVVARFPDVLGELAQIVGRPLEANVVLLALEALKISIKRVTVETTGDIYIDDQRTDG